MARIELSNIGGGTTLSLTTTGTSGAATLAGSVLNIPVYQGQLTLTTTGTSGAATLSGDILNIPQYSGGGGGTPAGSTGQIQYNNAGSFGASANLAWDNANVRFNIGAPSSPTGKLNVKGSGTLTTVNTRLTNSGNTELFKVLDNGSTSIGTGFNWDNSGSKLGLGIASPEGRIHAFYNNFSDVATFERAPSFSNALAGSSILRASYGSTPSDGAGPSFSFQLKVGSTVNDIGSFGCARDGSDNSGFISFSTFLSGTQFERMRVSSNGDVLIGVTSSSARLHVRHSNTSSGTNVLLVQNSTPSDLYKIENNGKISYLATNTAAGTTGAQTINRPSGTVNFGIGAGSLVVTNSLCTTSSIVFATVRTNDATAYIKNVVPAAGSFTINLGANATAETSVGFFIIN